MADTMPWEDAANGTAPVEAAALAQANGDPTPEPNPSKLKMAPPPAPAGQSPSGQTSGSTPPQAPNDQQKETTPWEDAQAAGTPAPDTSGAKELLNPLPPDNSAMRKYVEGNLQVYNAANAERGEPQPDQHEATSFLEALEAGWQMSISGLGIRGKMPDTVLPENATRAYRIAFQISSLAGDMPAMLAGGFFGGLGGAAEGSVVPGLGTVTVGALGAGAAAMAAPPAIRKMMIDHYTKGDIQTSGEFFDRLLSTTWEAIKGGITGAATTATGGAAAVAGPLAKFGAELATMTTVGAGLEGHAPHAQDFIDGALVLGGMHGVGMVSEKLRNIYAATGERPETVLAAARTNPELAQELMSHDKKMPDQASPTTLKNVPLEVKEGEEPETARNQLVQKDLSIQPPSDPIKMEDRSPEEQEIASKIGMTTENSPSLKDRFAEFYAKNVDWTDPLKAAVAATYDKSGVKLTAEQDPHIQERLFAAHQDFLRRVFDEGVPNEKGEFDGVGLNDIYKRVPGDDQAGFDLFSMAKRAVELDDKGKTPWSDFNREGAEKVISDGNDKFLALHEERVQFQNDVLDYGVRKGVINSGVAYQSKEQNKEYLPSNRIMDPDEMTGRIDSNGQLINKIEGSERDLKDPRMAIYDNTAAIIKRAAINDIRTKAFLNLHYEDENGDLRNDFLRQVPWTGAKNQVPIWRDGQKFALEGTPLVIDSLKRLDGDPTMSSFVTSIAGAFSKAVRVGTMIDPGFGFRHFFRSTMMSGVYSQTGQIPFFHPAMALGEFMEGKSEDYKNWLSKGGATQGFNELEDSYIKNGLQESDSKYPFLEQAWNVIKKPLDASEAFIKMTDNLVRFTEYKRTVEQGGSPDQAAFNAREVTPDFAKAGLQRSALRTAVAFQGAHINSLARMGQAFAEDTQGTILRMSALMGISAAMYFVNKDDKDVNDLPNYQKDLYWNFNVSRMFDSDYDKNSNTNTGTIFRLPKPWGPGILFGSGTERALDSFFTGNPDAFKGYARSLVESVVPNIIPTAAAPILDQMANKNLFTGRQLVNESQQKMLPEMQYQPYTSETAKQLGKLISHVPGVKDIGPSSDPLASPAVIENYIRDWTGIAGGWALKIGDAGLRAAGVTPSDKGLNSVDTPWAEEPILNEFATRFPSMKTQSIQDFYQNKDESDKIFNSIRAATKAGNITLASGIASEHSSNMMRLNSISQTVTNGRKMIGMIQDNQTIDPVQKRQLVDGVLFQIGSAAKMGNQMMSDFKNQVEQAKQKGGK